jgi:hypothetical protein
MEAPYSSIRQFRIVQQILLHSIIPIVCSGAIGFLVSRWGRVGSYPYVLQFIMDATLASFFFYALAYLRKRDAYAVLLILFLLTLLVTRSTRPMYVLRDLVNTGGLAAAVLLYARLVRRNPDPHYQYYGFVFSGILGVCNIVAWCLQFFVVEFVFSKHQQVDFMRFVWFAGFIGFLVGLGVGVGILINRKVLDRANAAKTVT